MAKSSAVQLKRLAAGSYETHDGRYLTYSYHGEDGSGVWWSVYLRKADDGSWSGCDDDEMIGAYRTLAEARSAIARDMGVPA